MLERRRLRSKPQEGAPCYALKRLIARVRRAVASLPLPFATHRASDVNRLQSEPIDFIVHLLMLCLCESELIT